MKLFIDSVAAYLGAWTGVLSHRGRRMAPLTPRRLLVLALFPLFLALQLFHGVCLCLDHLLFPGFRQTLVRRPVFILGVPRSGTTFLHRELARDARFTAPRTWEVLFAPALCQRYLIAFLARVDAVVGHPLSRALASAVHRGAGRLEAIHSVGLEAAEEDYLALLPAAGCFFLHMLFPDRDAFTALGLPDRMPAARRRRLTDHYHGLLQRQVYFHGGRQMLSKNAALAGWTPELARRYPDACLVICIREPGAALASQLTSLESARRLFATYPRDEDLQDSFTIFYQSWWKTLDECAASLRPTPLVVEQEWLRGHTDAVLKLVYGLIDRDPPACGTSAVSAGASGPRRSRWSLDDAPLQAMGAPYERLLRIAERQRSAAP